MSVEQKTAPTTKEAVKPGEDIASLKAELEALKASNKKFEEDALAEACKRAGVTPQDLIAHENLKKANKVMVDFDIGRQVVHINGYPYQGQGKAPREVVDVIVAAAAAARNERLQQMTGNKYEVENLATGGIRTKITGKVEASVDL